MTPVEILLTVFVGVTAIAIVLEALAVRRTLRATDVAVERLTSLSNGLEGDVREVVQQARKIVGDIDHLRAAFEGLGAQVNEVSRMVEGRANDLDVLVQRIVEVGGQQASKVDEVVSDTVAKFRQTTDLIQRDVMQPVVEIAALVKGVRAGFGFLFSGAKRARPGFVFEDADDEMFI